MTSSNLSLRSSDDSAFCSNCLLTGSKKAKQQLDDEADLPLLPVCVKPTTQEFYEQHNSEVSISYLFDSVL